MADGQTTVQWKINLQGQENASAGLEKVKTSAMAISTVFLAVVETAKLVGAALQNLTAEFVQGDVAVQRLKNSMIAMGKFNPEDFKGLNDFADAVKATVGIDDDDIRNIVAFNTTLDMTARQSKITAESAIGLSRAFGTDLKTANQQLTATLSGQVGLLSRYLPELKNLTVEQLRHGEAIDVVRGKYKGFLTGDDSPSMLVKQISLETADLKKAFGSGLFDVSSMKDILALLRSINEVGLAKSLGAELRLSLILIKNIGSQVYNVVGLVGNLIKGTFTQIWSALREVFNNLIATVSSGLARLLEKFPNALVNRALPGLKEDLAQIGKDFASYAQDDVQNSLGATKDIQQSWSNVLDSSKEVDESVTKLWNNTKKVVDESKNISTVYDTIRKTLDKPQTVASTKGKVNIIPTFDWDKSIAEGAKALQGGFLPVIDFLSSTFGSKISTYLTELVPTIVGGLSDLSGKIGDFFGKDSAFGNVTKGLLEGISTLANAMPGFGESARALIQIMTMTPEQTKQMVNGLLNSVLQIIENIGTQLPMIFDTIGERLPEIVKKVITGLVLGFPLLIINSITSGLKAISVVLFDMLFSADFWNSFGQGFINAMTHALSNLKDALGKLINGLLFGSADKVIQVAKSTERELYDPKKDAGAEIFKIKDYAEDNQVKNFTESVDQITEAGQMGLFQGLLKGLTDIFVQIGQQIVSLFTGLGPLFQSLGLQILNGFMSSVGYVFYNYGNQIWNGFFSPVGDKFYDFGSQIWQGFSRSITDIAGSLGFGGGGGIVGSIGGTIGGVIGSIGGSFGFAEGGLVGGSAPFIGNSTGNDIINARLSPGEYVINREDMARKDLSGAAKAMGISSMGGSTGDSYSVSINVGSGSTLTESQLRNSIVPIIISELKKQSRNGKQIIDSKGVYK